ncbi:unnamed protein product [Rhizophagus irregularis]|nr:unnamed protein product [Rhizophagus irregularis]
MKVFVDEYINATSAIKEVRKLNNNAHYNPLWWSIFNLREVGLSPFPDLPHAKKFFLKNEIDQLVTFVKGIIYKEKEKLSKSSSSLLKALALSKIESIQTLAKENGAHRVSGLCMLLMRKGAELNDYYNQKEIVDNINIDEEDTIYIRRCILDA